MAISFSCDVCTEPCAGAARRPCVLIERAAMLLIANSRWVKGITIMAWDDAAAGTGRYHHVHADKCLPTWISRNTQSALNSVLDASRIGDQLPVASEEPRGNGRARRGAERPSRQAVMALD
jgi:hypothetical protein